MDRRQINPDTIKVFQSFRTLLNEHLQEFIEYWDTNHGGTWGRGSILDVKVDEKNITFTRAWGTEERTGIPLNSKQCSIPVQEFYEWNQMAIDELNGYHGDDWGDNKFTKYYTEDEVYQVSITETYTHDWAW